MNKKKKTKLARLLWEREMTLTDLHDIIAEQNETKVGLDRLSRIVNGRQVNYHTDTLWKIARALGVTVDDVYEPPKLQTSTDESGGTQDLSQEEE